MQGHKALLLAVLMLGVTVQAEEHDPVPEVLSFDFGAEAYSAGDRMDIRLSAQDDEGILGLSFLLEDPEGREVGPDRCEKLPMDDGPPTEASTTCQFMLPYSAPGGNWTLSAVLVQNGTEFQHELQPGKDFNESASIQLQVWVEAAPPDVDPPGLLGISVEHEVMAQAGTNRINLTVQDRTGVASGRVHLEDPEDHPLEADCFPRDNHTDDLVCSLDVPGAPGQYTVQRIVLEDVEGNRGTLFRGVDFQSDEDHRLSFEVQEPDEQPPVLRSYYPPTEPLRRGDNATIRVNASDNKGIQMIMLLASAEEGGDELDFLECGTFEGPLVEAQCVRGIPEDHPLGLTLLQWIFIKDHAGNDEVFRVSRPDPSEPGQAELLASIAFTVLPDPLRTSMAQDLVAGIAPARLEYPAGTVATVVVAQGSADLQNVSFVFEGASGQHLGVFDCAADHHPLTGGFRCPMVVPPDAAQEVYRLAQLRVRSDGDWTPVVLDPAQAPGLRLNGTANGTGLPEGWQRHVEDGMTLPTFKEEAEDVPMPTPPPARTATPQVPADQDSPAPGVWAGLAALAWAALRRGPGRSKSDGG